ncbi:Uncharacterized protein ALO84_04806 [Pseudomonas syringae pv. maculicola]|nr:Uncharacterized protein ALO84_04806 [Pseudomonas syringae pv. maculicola]
MSKSHNLQPQAALFHVADQQPLRVTTCNRNGLDLQSLRFSTGIDCVYLAPRTSIDCKRTCIQPLRPAIERNQPRLNATEKPMILASIKQWSSG